MHQIGEVEDIDEANEAKLKALEIHTTDDFLARAATPAGRAEVAAAIGVAAQDILRWANCADLMRVDGIGMQFADLLEAAGVDTIPELAQRNAANLHAKLAAVNAEGKLAGRAPTSAEVEGWIAQAKELPRILDYSSGGANGSSAGPGTASAAAPAVPSESAAAPASAPVAAAAPTGDAASGVSTSPAPTPSPAPASSPPPAPTAAVDEGADHASATAHGAVSRSEGLAQGRSWLQNLVDKLRGRA